ncbi:MAG TPA: TaqI-like C-terminal specificity domain-containing protein, partial [Bacteroidales bacterium]|nr:TaqI-like C-terminal specificity domain-containing protein [Bacteroidales bacterium]
DPEWMFGLQRENGQLNSAVGGYFDIVVGNPPYVVIEKRVFKENYSFYKLQEGKIDLYRLFIELSVTSLLKNNGILSFITPNTFLTIPSCKKLRKYLLENSTFLLINDYDISVFNASVNSVVFVISMMKSINYNTSVGFIDKDGEKRFSMNLESSLKNEKFEIFINMNNSSKSIINKLLVNNIQLKDIDKLDFCLGEQPYHNTIHSQEQIKNRFLHSKFKVNDNFLKEFGGKNILKYHLKEKDDNWLDYSAELYTKPDIKYFSNKRILLREIIGKTLTATYVENTFLVNKSVYVIIFNGSDEENFLKYLLALLNSKIIGFYVSNFGDKARQTLFPRITMRTLKSIPIPHIDKLHQQPIITLVSQILDAKKENPHADTSKWENEIDQLVYQLYELTDEEIAIVEGKE